MKLNTLRQLICVLVMAAAVSPAFAVTDKEMEEARAITAQCYLRYANDGSGYLDEFKVKSMSELEGKLKTQEKENLKAFNRVKVPSDYASWDKARLVEFWSVTFFTSPELADKGKGAKKRVKSRIEKMEIGKPAPEAAPAAKQDAPDGAMSASAAAASLPDAERAMTEQDSLLAAQMDVEKDVAEETEPVMKKKNSNTWVYLMILGILVAAVIVLVVFAAKTMKKSDERLSSVRNDEEDEPVRVLQKEGDVESASAIREKFAATLDGKNRDISALKGEIQSLEAENRRISSDYEKLKSEYYSMSKEIVALREQNTRLKEAAEVSAAAMQTRQAPAQSKPQPKDEILHVIYLGKVNQKGIFVRADRKISLGNTIYRLDTDDGFVGTFRVVRNDSVERLALEEPAELLANGCSAKDIEATEGVTRIVTETPGTAIFENGCWKVLRKAKIRYE